MRIVITNNGQKIIQKLYSSKSSTELFNNPCHDTKEKNNPLMKNYYSLRSSAKTRLPKISKSNSLILSSNNNIKIIRPKQIILKKKNLRIPLAFLKRFEKNNEKNNEKIIVQPINILSNLENKNLSTNDYNSKNEIRSKYNTLNESKINSNSYLVSNNSSSIFLPRIKSCYSLREIMAKSCLDNFDNTLKEKLDSEKHDLPFNDKILRDDWSNKDIFGEYDKKKDKEINTRNFKLIEYLMEKKTISRNFLKKINDCDEKKIMILDKLSGKFLDQKEKQKIFDKRMRAKIENRKDKDSLAIRKILLEINRNVNKNIKDNHMNNYMLVKNSNKGVYRNVFKRFRRKYWKKEDNFARYFHNYQKVHFEEI